MKGYQMARGLFLAAAVALAVACGPTAVIAQSVQPPSFQPSGNQAFDEWRARVETDGMAPVRARWLALADTIGRRVSIDGVSGVAVDLDPDGALVLEDGGRRHRVTTAGRWCRPRRCRRS